MPRINPTRNEDGHHCKEKIAHAAFGPAVGECFEDENGRFWATNGEYASVVRYCPFCGEEAATQPEASSTSVRAEVYEAIGI